LRLLGLAPHDVVDPRVVIKPVGESLAHLLVRRRAFPGWQDQVVEIERGHVSNDDSLSAVDFLDCIVRQEERDIDFTLLEHEAFCRGLFDVADNDLIDMVAIPAAPIVGIAAEDCLLGLIVRIEDVRPRANHVATQPGLGQISILLILSKRLWRDDVRRVQPGEGRERTI
jgi:hypothetical protein